MAMRATTVRFSDDLWALLEQESAAAGVSAAQFVRDATVLRVAYLMGRRGEANIEEALERISGVPTREEDAAMPPPDVLAAVRDADRLRALRDTGLLDSSRDEAFDRHARIASEALDAPVALVSLVDEDRQYFKSCLGLPEPWLGERESPLSHSFCQHAVASREPLVVSDAREHPVLRSNLAIRDMNIIAYAGVPLIDSAGHALGTLCTIDDHPRHWTRHQLGLLRDIAASVVREIELTRAGSVSADTPRRNGDR
ncbi:MAG: GAF domain-containing protein [Actinomycetota bacterium]|nr:GAF domain-containing protein [Actinomycetota bacterium]